MSHAADSVAAEDLRWRAPKVRGHVRIAALRLLFIAVLIGAWQVAPNKILPVEAVGRPPEVAAALWRLITNGKLLTAFSATAIAVVYSVVIGGVIGIALAAATSFRVTRWLLDPLITVGYAIPKIGLISVYIILLGVNTASHIALVVSTILFVYFLAMRQALEEVDDAYLNAFRLLGAGWLRIGTSLVLPTAIPHLLGASRIAVPLGLATAVFAELRVPTEGLGALLGNFTYFTSIAQSVAVAIFIVVVAYVIDLVFGEALRRYNELLGARVV